MRSASVGSCSGYDMKQSAKNASVAGVTRAPRTLLPQVEAIDGVLDAEGRIVKLALLDMPGMA